MRKLSGFDGARVYFSPCGIGLGHVSRSVPIAQEVERRGGEVLFSTYLEGVDYISKFGFPVVSAPEIHLENDPTGSIDLKASTVSQSFSSGLTLLDQVRFEVQTMMAFDPHVAFSDSRLSTIYAARLLRIPCVLTLNQFLPRVPREKDTNFFRLMDGTIMTILGRQWTLAKALVIPDFPEPYTISLDSLRMPRRYGARVQLVGSIMPLKQEDNLPKEQIREKLGVEEDQKLIYAGISGPLPERMPLIRMLIPLFRRFPRRYHVVMSMGNPYGGNTPRKMGNLTLYPWIENRFDYLNACDLVISRGGHETIMQSISYQKPSIIVPVPKHPEQYGNARRAQELGFADSMHQRDVSLESLVKSSDRITRNHTVKDRLQRLNDEVGLENGIEKTLDVLAEYIR